MAAFLFLGPELGKKQDAVNAVRQKYKNAQEFVFYPDETKIRVISDNILNRDLFADSRIITVKCAELIRGEADISLLSSSIKSMDQNTALILLSDENKVAASLDNAIPKNNKQVFYELSEREKESWVRSFFNEKGFKIDNDSISIVLEMVENNTDALKKECSRLIYFLPKNEIITAEEIEKWLSHNREESVFTLFSRIACGDLTKALESITSMLAAKTESYKIFSGLAGCFRKLSDYLELQEEGELSYPELKKIGIIAPKARDDYAAAARRYNSDAVETCLYLTASYSILLRSLTSEMEKIFIDKYILAIFKAASQIRR